MILGKFAVSSSSVLCTRDYLVGLLRRMMMVTEDITLNLPSRLTIAMTSNYSISYFKNSRVRSNASHGSVSLVDFVIF